MATEVVGALDVFEFDSFGGLSTIFTDFDFLPADAFALRTLGAMGERKQVSYRNGTEVVVAPL